jgi:tetratricopeptide (TPR) repeat protein
MSDFENFNDQNQQSALQVSQIIQNYESRLPDGDFSGISPSDFSSIINHYYGDFKMKEAYQAAATALKQHPEDIELLLDISNFYINLQRYEKAVPILRKIMERNPSLYEAQIQMANVYDGWGEPEKALSYLDEVLDRYPANKEDLLTTKYSILINNNRYKEAIPILKHLLEMNNDHPMATFELMSCYEAIGKPEKAIEFYQNLVDKDPYNYKLWNNLGFLYTLVNDDDKAIHTYEISLALNDKIAETSYCLGNIYSNNEEYHKSIDYYLKAITGGGGDDLVYMELGFAYLNTENYEESKKCFKKSIELYSLGHDSWYGLGMAYDGLKLYRKALAYLKHAIRLYPENGKYWYELGNIYMNLSKSRLSVKAYRRAVKFYPSLIDAWIDLVLLLFDQGDSELALSFINKGISKNKGNAELLYIKAGIMIETGEIEKGEILLEKALKLNPYISYILFDHFPALHNNSMVKQIIQSYEN